MKFQQPLKIVSAWFWSLLLAGTLFACDTSHAENTQQHQSPRSSKKDKKAPREAASTAIEILNKYELPAILKEVSGIAYLGKNQFACVQDESGIIFIYNTKTTRIEKEITFGAAGDYEGIAVVDKTAYVVRSDGKIFEVGPINGQPSKIQQYTTSLTTKNNVEGLTYNAKHQRLLISIKGSEANNQAYKGIYALDLKTKKFLAEPVAKISLTDPQLAVKKGKKLKNAIQPSELAVHPITGELYVLDASNPQLFILNAQGRIQNRYKLDEQDFAQPEGMIFSPSGELFISNEGKKGNGNILQVKIQTQ